MVYLRGREGHRPDRGLQYHTMPCNAMQYHAIPYHTYHTIHYHTLLPFLPKVLCAPLSTWYSTMRRSDFVLAFALEVVPDCIQKGCTWECNQQSTQNDTAHNWSNKNHNVVAILSIALHYAPPQFTILLSPKSFKF